MARYVAVYQGSSDKYCLLFSSLACLGDPCSDSAVVNFCNFFIYFALLAFLLLEKKIAKKRSDNRSGSLTTLQHPNKQEPKNAISHLC